MTPDYNDSIIHSIQSLNISFTKIIINKMHCFCHISINIDSNMIHIVIAKLPYQDAISIYDIHLISDSDQILNGILNTVIVISMTNKDYKHHHRHHLGQ